MRVEELVSMANKSAGSYSYTEKEATDFFRKKNLGHWPSEKGEIVLNNENGDIILTIGKNMIGSNRDLTPSGKVWLIKQFFNQFQSEAIKDLNGLEEYKHKGRKVTKGETLLPKDFHNRMLKRMSNGYSQFVKSGDTRLAFVERKRVNPDNTFIYGYDLNILDSDRTSKYALMVPCVKPVIYVFEEYKGNIVKTTLDVDGRSFENMEPWERAEYIAMSHLDIFDVERVSKKYVEAALLLTESIEERKIETS